MIVDSSALIAIMKKEPDWRTYAERLNAASHSEISAATYVEVSVVVERLTDPVLNHEFDDLIDRFNIRVEPVTVEQALIARQAFRDYGRGSGHAANLNFGDCFSYALARAKREPILFKGDNFGHTDLRSAIH